MENWLTIPQAASHYGVSENAIRHRMRRRNYADCEKRGGIWYINVGEASHGQAALATQDDAPPDSRDLMARLIAEQQETNRLLRLIAEPAPKQWRWPWKRRPPTPPATHEPTQQ